MWLFVSCWSVEAHKRLPLIVEPVDPGATSDACTLQANIWVDVGRHQVSVVAGSQVILVVKMTHEGSPISIPVHGMTVKYILHRMLKGLFEHIRRNGTECLEQRQGLLAAVYPVGHEVRLDVLDQVGPDSYHIGWSQAPGMEIHKRQFFVGSNKASSNLDLGDSLGKPYFPGRGQVTLQVSKPSRNALPEPPPAQQPPPLPLKNNIRDVVHQLLPKTVREPDHETHHLRETDAVKVVPLAFELVGEHVKVAILPVPAQ